MEESRGEILLIEDNPNDVKLTLHAFKSNNLAVRVQIARDGVEALALLLGDDQRITLPKVILLDLKLPLIDGLEVLRRIRADPRTRHLPVVVLTTSSEERDIAECYALGVNSYIVKPVDFEQFAETTRTLGLYWLQMNQSPPI